LVEPLHEFVGDFVTKGFKNLRESLAVTGIGGLLTNTPTSDCNKRSAGRASKYRAMRLLFGCSVVVAYVTACALIYSFIGI